MMALICYNKEIRKIILGRLLLRGLRRYMKRPESSGSWPVSQPIGWDLLYYLMSNICSLEKRPWRKTETCTSDACIPVKTSSLFLSSVELFDFILYQGHQYFQHFVLGMFVFPAFCIRDICISSILYQGRLYFQAFCIRDVCISSILYSSVILFPSDLGIQTFG